MVLNVNEAFKCEWRLKSLKIFKSYKIYKSLFNKISKIYKKGLDINTLNLNIYVINEYKKYFDIKINELEWF